MKKELSSIEIKYLVQEFQNLLGARVDKIYQPKKKELLIQLYVTNKGKQLLRIVLPGFIWLTSAKPDMPVKMPGFCAFLRKHLDNSRVKKIEQFESERIIKIVFEKKEVFEMYIELFSKGNIILCQKEKILVPLEIQKWKDRSVKKGETYKFASRDNIFKMNLFDFEKKILKSKDNISKTLALGLGLGGVYSKEVCLLSDVDKSDKIKDKKLIKKIYDALQTVLNKKINANAVLKSSVVKDIVPFELKLYSDFESKVFKSYNLALDSVLAGEVVLEQRNKASKTYDAKLQQIDKRIEMQVKNLDKLEKDSSENQRKGELIYENYQKVKKSIETAKKNKKREIKIKL